MPKLSLKTWMSIVTAFLVILILFFARKDLQQAWHLMTGVNLWILALLIPVLLLNYYSSGEIFFAYLRAKKRLKDVPHFLQIRTTLEMNFVNHVLPSGGVSGVSYVTWRLGKLGVSSSRALMSQVVRVVLGIIAFLIFLVIAVIAVTIDGSVNRFIILFSSGVASVMIAAIGVCVFIIASDKRVRGASRAVTKFSNKAVEKLTFGRKKQILEKERVESYMVDMHDDYVELTRDISVLKWPFVWALIFTVLEVAIFFIVFWSLGAIINPALILIAYGMAMLAAVAVVTPGGAGAYEAIMIAFLTISGVSADVAVAGIILARVIILVAILGLGWGFYQQSLNKGSHGRPNATV